MYHLLITGTWLVRRSGSRRSSGCTRPTSTATSRRTARSGSGGGWPPRTARSTRTSPSSRTRRCSRSRRAAWRASSGRAGSGRLPRFFLLLMPVVIRFTATQYVDIFVGGTFAAAAFFALRWLRPLREPRWSDALLAGAGLGLAAGAKVLGLLYVLPLAGMAVLLARGEWRRRVPQLAGAILALTLLGGFFYPEYRGRRRPARRPLRGHARRGLGADPAAHPAGQHRRRPVRRDGLRRHPGGRLPGRAAHGRPGDRRSGRRSCSSCRSSFSPGSSPGRSGAACSWSGARC